MPDPTEPIDSPMDNEPDTLSTPEGDNEDTPTTPLEPIDAPIERPRGDEPHPSQPLRPALD